MAGLMTMHDLFHVKAGAISLSIADEQSLIARAQTDEFGDTTAIWDLLFQYRGLLQKTAYSVRQRIRGMTQDQIEDLEADLVLAAVETIKSFDSSRFVRLSQVLPGKLRDVAMEMTTALAVPRGTLSLWFKIWREAEQDFRTAEVLAPNRGMSANTFRAISHALAHADSEWVNVPYTAGVPTPDQETAKLAESALAVLSPIEREVIEHVYGFRGDPKTDEEISLILNSTRNNVKSQRRRALAKMQKAMIDE